MPPVSRILYPDPPAGGLGRQSFIWPSGHPKDLSVLPGCIVTGGTQPA